MTLDVYLNQPADDTVSNEYIIEIHIGESGAMVVLSDDVKWANDVYPEFSLGFVYVISIVRNKAIFVKFSA